MDNKDEIAFKYAWDWFSYHANQRMMAFHFFLIIVGALMSGYGFNQEKWPRIGICVFGIFITFAFMLLDRRNKELVVDAGEELNKYEVGKLSIEINMKDEGRKNNCCHRITTHSFIFGAIQSGVAVLFIFAAIYAYLK